MSSAWLPGTLYHCTALYSDCGLGTTEAPSFFISPVNASGAARMAELDDATSKYSTVLPSKA